MDAKLRKARKAPNLHFTPFSNKEVIHEVQEEHFPDFDLPVRFFKADEKLELPLDTPEIEAVIKAILGILRERAQPSVWELINALDRKLGLKARWVVDEALQCLIDDHSLTRLERQYLSDLCGSDDWREALGGSEERPGRQIEPTIDSLIRESRSYRNSVAFQEMISFMANFTDYSPFNNMLVWLQNPSCSFYATQKDWLKRFGRFLKEDARPMVILAPMHPIMLVYDLDSTEGPPLPEKLRRFARFEGEWNPKRLSRTIENASTRDLIRIDTVKLSSTLAGFANISIGQDGMRMRIALHDRLDEPSRYGVLLHELAHIYLGHLGSFKDSWWASRGCLDQWAREVEAEAVAYIVSRRAGLRGASPQYVSGYLDGEDIPRQISLDMIAKVAGRLDKMGKSRLGRSRREKEVINSNGKIST